MITKKSSTGKSHTILGAMAVLAVSVVIGAVFFVLPEMQFDRAIRNLHVEEVPEEED